MLLPISVLTILAGCAASTAAEPLPPTTPDPGFWDHWGDGKAELAGYQVIQPRYGTERPGEAVLIFVTETFTDGQRVKSDGGHGDEFPVIKLNEARDFQTGVYDYNTMTSVFVPLDGRTHVGVPTKLTFSGQEWCGHVYDELVVTGSRYARQIRSYFDGESDADASLAIPSDAMFLDTMPLVVRGLTGLQLKPGESRTVSTHARLMDLRFDHRDATWTPMTLHRAAEPTSVDVPAGTIDATIWTLGKWSWAVEVAAPHRLVRWTGPGGEVGELTGSMRSAYWNRSGPDGVVDRATLGLGDPSWIRQPR